MIKYSLRYFLCLYSFFVIIPEMVIGQTLEALNDTSASTPVGISIGFMMGGNVSLEKNGDFTPGLNFQSHISIVYDSWNMGIGYRILPGDYKEQAFSPNIGMIYQHDMNVLMLSGGREFKKNEFTFSTTMQLLYVNTNVATAEPGGSGGGWGWLSTPNFGSWDVLSDIRQSCFGVGLSAIVQSKISKYVYAGISFSFHKSKLASVVFMDMTLSLNLSAH